MIFNLTSTGDFDIQDNGVSALFVKDDGNVGIGTTNPGKTLDIVSTWQKGIRITGDGDNIFEVLDSDDPSNRAFVVADNGYVGIGLTNPSLAKLEIYGDSETMFGVYDSDNISTIGIGTTAPSEKVDVNLGWNNKFQIAGDTNGTAIFEVHDIDSPTSQVLVFNNGGNVGIGTTNPGAKLDVEGDLLLQTGTNVNNIAITVGATGDDNTLVTEQGIREAITSGTSSYDTFLELTDTISSYNTGRVLFESADAVIDSASFVWDTSNNWLTLPEVRAISSAGLKLYDDGGNGIFIEDGGNVGIGTTGPNALLQIGGGGLASGYGNLYVNTDSNGRAILISEESGGETWQLGVNASGDLLFQDSTAGAMVTFQDGGNVGIGTTNPSAFKLQVAGDVGS